MQDPAFVHSAFSSIAARYVTANHLLSLGIDISWRSRVVDIVAEWKASNLLDLATGTGDLALALGKALPELDILGSDFCRPMLEIAKQRGLRNILEADAMNLPLEDESYDVITVAFGLRNMADYAGALKEFRRVLKTGGHLLILDFSLPSLPFIARPYDFYLHHVVPMIGGFVTRRREAYSYLGESIRQFPQGEAMKNLISSCGYGMVTAKPLSMGIASIYTAEKI